MCIPYRLKLVMMSSILLILAQACMPKAFQGTDSKPKEDQSLPGPAESEPASGAPGIRDGSLSDSDPIAQEPAVIAGGYLVDPLKLKVSRTAVTADISGAAFAVLETPSSRPKVLDIELYAYDSATRAIELKDGLLYLKTRRVATSKSAADGSFVLQATISPADWLFVKILSGEGSALSIDPTRIQASAVWIDNDGNRPRRLDQAAAYALRGMISPSQSLLDAIARLKATSACPGCDLNGADLRVNNLNACDLRRAQLIGAKFNGSSVTNSDLREADLRGADFALGFLASTDFTGALITGANFQGADTNTAIGLALPQP